MKTTVSVFCKGTLAKYVLFIKLTDVITCAYLYMHYTAHTNPKFVINYAV
jgi:hypothetical protein